jgi:hypothetical protein
MLLKYIAVSLPNGTLFVCRLGTRPSNESRRLGGAATQFLLLATFRYRTLCLYGAVDDKTAAGRERTRTAHSCVVPISVGTEPSIAQRPSIRRSPDPALQANLYLCRPSSHASAELRSLAVELRMAGPVPHIAARALTSRDAPTISSPGLTARRASPERWRSTRCRIAFRHPATVLILTT